jgi:5-methylcytosine-specific restriction endonuclease McrA
VSPEVRADFVDDIVAPPTGNDGRPPPAKNAGLSRRLLHPIVMARISSPPSKGRKQQALQKLVAREIARTVTRNPAGHIWLARHVERQNGRCAYCGIPVFLPPKHGKEDRRATLDHVVPLVRGGADSEANTVAACLACNNAKGGAMTAQAFRMSAFCIARKAFAATVPERKTAKPVIVKVRKRPRTETGNG